jgi:bacterioferritin-associated ferredoxin
LIVCVCRFVNDGAVRAARDAGARTVEAIGATTGAGTCCGSCRPSIAAILAEPCRARACPDCPSRGDAVPRRIAADKEESP